MHRALIRLPSWVAVTCALLGAACGGSSTSASAQSARSADDLGKTDGKAGTDKEHPVMRCGPLDSYAYVSEYKCADGSTPLRGEPSEGQRARSGNARENSAGHPIDLYVVPCPEGEVEIYVDMYGCKAYEDMLEAMKTTTNPFGPPGKALPRERLLAIASVFGKMSAKPFSEATRNLLPFALEWLMKTPDVTTQVCPYLQDMVDDQGKQGKGRTPLAQMVLAHSILGVAAHQIRDPKANFVDAQVAGLETALGVYEQYRTNLKQPMPALDKLLAMQDRNQLRDWFVKNADCKGP